MNFKFTLEVHFFLKKLLTGSGLCDFAFIVRESHGTVLERTLRLVGIEKKEDVQRMSLEALDAKITIWIDVIPIAVKIFFFLHKGIIFYKKN